MQVVRRAHVDDAHRGIFEGPWILDRAPCAVRAGEGDPELSERVRVLYAGMTGAQDQGAPFPFHLVIVSAAAE